MQLQNPHPPLLLHGSRRAAETTAAADGNTTEQVEVQGGVKERPNGHEHEGDRESGDDEAARDGVGAGGGSGMTLLRWDQSGEVWLNLHYVWVTLSNNDAKLSRYHGTILGPKSSCSLLYFLQI